MMGGLKKGSGERTRQSLMLTKVRLVGWYSVIKDNISCGLSKKWVYQDDYNYYKYPPRTEDCAIPLIKKLAVSQFRKVIMVVNTYEKRNDC